MLRCELDEKGFAILDAVYSQTEVEKLIEVIHEADPEKETFRKSAQLFAIRQFLKEIPEAVPLIFNDRLKALVNEVFGADYFPVKAIYFDKPAASNWFVAYHQDLTISVDKKITQPDYGPWTTKQGQFAVQPPPHILQNIFTIRIHLDDTDEHNGALKVFPGSHRKGILRPEALDLTQETENICRVKKGGIMLMKPLLMHASGRSTNTNRRRVIHIEFSKDTLPEGMGWPEKILT